ncbi:MAG: hypothetical protein LBI27_00445 [Clostridiales bacterium]|jgi:hypothetical protein|nr:hypothetical protein [Clostridiales bacterium]
MAKKLRKMLGDVNSVSAVALRELIDTQSRETIRKWCINYSEAKILPIFEKYSAGETRPRNALNAARDVMDGKAKLAAVKSIIGECQSAAKELDANPTAQAAARAIGCGAGIVQTLTHSLGLFFYAAAAIAYDRVGLDASDEEYAAIAEEVCIGYTNALREIAVENEPNPAKLKWNC